MIAKAKLDPRPRNEGLLALRMDYTTKGEHREPEAEQDLQEINGWTIADHKQLTDFCRAKGRRLDGVRLLDLLRAYPEKAVIARTSAIRKTSTDTGGDGRGHWTGA